MGLCVWYKAIEQRARNRSRERAAKRAQPYEQKDTDVELAVTDKVVPSVPSASAPQTERQMLPKNEEMMTPGDGMAANHNNLRASMSPRQSIEVR